MGNMCIECRKRPIQIKKYQLCRACYAKKRRHGEIRQSNPELTEADIGRALLAGVEMLHEELKQKNQIITKYKSVEQEFAHQRLVLETHIRQQQEKVIELTKQLNSKKTRPIKLEDLQKKIRGLES